MDKRKENALLIEDTDNVVVAAEMIEKGKIALYVKENQTINIMTLSDIPIYHKLAICNINKGEKIIKYGHVIGRATKNINAGEHVHCHNVVSMQEGGV